MSTTCHTGVRSNSIGDGVCRGARGAPGGRVTPGSSGVAGLRRERGERVLLGRLDIETKNNG